MKGSLREVCLERNIIHGDETDKEVRQKAIAYIREGSIGKKGISNLSNENIINILEGNDIEFSDSSFVCLYVSAEVRYIDVVKHNAECFFVMQGLPTHDEVWEHIQKNKQKFVNDAIKRVNREFKKRHKKYELTDYCITKLRYDSNVRELIIGVSVKEDALH